MIRSPERIVAADVLRGFALLGILLVNMRYFSSPALYDDGAKGSALDRGWRRSSTCCLKQARIRCLPFYSASAQ
nr:hypothetical protein [Geobacillus sp. BMUD]